MNTIDNMRNEKYFYDHCKKFVYNHDFVKSYEKLTRQIHLLFGVNNFTLIKNVTIFNNAFVFN